jgi:hypothetical protein
MLRRGFFAALGVLFTPATAALAAIPTVSQPSDPDLITINPRELWLREAVYHWIWTMESLEKYKTMRVNDEWTDPRDILSLSEVLCLTPEQLESALQVRWHNMCGGAWSHLDTIHRHLKILQDDGRLHLYLPPHSGDHFTFKDSRTQEVYRAVFPIAKRLCIAKEIRIRV